MNVWEGVVLALNQIRTEKLKSFFSLLGVIIGVMFLLVVVSVIEGMDQYIKEDRQPDLRTEYHHRDPDPLGSDRYGRGAVATVGQATAPHLRGCGGDSGKADDTGARRS